VEVVDWGSLRAFFAKTQLNPDAHTFDELYALGVDKDAVDTKVEEFTSYFGVRSNEL